MVQKPNLGWRFVSIAMVNAVKKNSNHPGRIPRVRREGRWMRQTPGEEMLGSARLTEKSLFES